MRMLRPWLGSSKDDFRVRKNPSSTQLGAEPLPKIRPVIWTRSLRHARNGHSACFAGMGQPIIGSGRGLTSGCGAQH